MDSLFFQSLLEDGTIVYPPSVASLSLDGVNDHARSGNGSALAAFAPAPSGVGICIAFTMYVQGTLGNDCVCSYGKLGTGANISYDVLYDANNGRLRIGAARLAGAGTEFQSDAIFTAGNWYTCAIRIDTQPALTTVTLYVNGVAVSGTYIKQGNANIASLSGRTNGRFCVGAYVDYIGNFYSNPFQGYINNMCISGGGDSGLWTDSELRNISKNYNIDFETSGLMNNSASNRGVIFRFENNTNSEYTLSRNLQLRSGATYTTNVP